MDKRISYYMVFDTETANTMDDPMMYDIGGAIIDRRGHVYETFSFVIYDVFCADRALFDTAYYAVKRPIYEAQIADGSRRIVSIYTARQHLRMLCDKWNVRALIAHNARFDYKSTTRTLRYVTKSNARYFLPYGVPLWDTLKMAQDTICKQPTYIRWCERNRYLQKNGKPRATAEILYRYITLNNGFIESHTGLEDVLIEKEIFARCMRQHKKMRKSVW
ncbi:MAG: hypothetical protein J6S85_08215 [Methanobrevibacter sp.]|nr:hypothetical protein [Methanobrevibacter sp.]